MAYEFDFWNELIYVLQPQTDILIQELHDAIRVAEYSTYGLGFEKIANASGKEPLGADVYVGITISLLRNWQLKFWDGNYIAKVTGGNLVGGPGDDPVAYTPGVQVLLVQSAASTIVVTESGGGSGLPEGAYKVDLTVQTPQGAAIPNASVTIRDSTGTAVIGSFRVDTNGTKSFSLDAGTYKFYPFNVGYLFTVPTTVVVDDDKTVTLEGTPVAIDPPSLPGSCRIYEYCIDQSGAGVLPSVTARARIMEHSYDDGTGKFSTEQVEGTYDSSGYVYWDIVPGALVWFEIEELSVNVRVRVPDSTAGQEIRLGSLTPEEE